MKTVQCKAANSSTRLTGVSAKLQPHTGWAEFNSGPSSLQVFDRTGSTVELDFSIDDPRPLSQRLLIPLQPCRHGAVPPLDQAGKCVTCEVGRAPKGGVCEDCAAGRFGGSLHRAIECSGWSPQTSKLGLKGAGSSCALWGYRIHWCYVSSKYRDIPGVMASSFSGRYYTQCATTKNDCARPFRVRVRDGIGG